MASVMDGEPVYHGLIDTFDGADDGDAAFVASALNQSPSPIGAPTTSGLDAIPSTTAPVDPAFCSPGSNWTSFQDVPPVSAPYSFDDVYPAAPFSFAPPWDNAPPQFVEQLAHTSGPQMLSDISPTSLNAEPMSNPSGQSLLLAQNGSGRPVLRPEVLSTLTPAQQEKVKSIAVPAHLRYRSPPKSEPSPHSSTGENPKDTSSSPDASAGTKAAGRKRKASDRKSSADEDEDDDDDDDTQPVKKTSHNMIEKRYRTNLNDKIAALRDSVPSLRIMTKSAKGEDTTGDREELHGLTPAHKLNKATVLSKATEYIRHLEKRNNRLLDENKEMAERLKAFERLIENSALAQAGAGSPHQQMPPTSQYPQESTTFMATQLPTPGTVDSPGMIQVPDEMKRIIQAQAAVGRPYPIPQQQAQQNSALMRQQLIQQQQQAAHQGRWQHAGPYFGRLMVGSLAGLMILEAVRENEQSNESPAGRGLLAPALNLLGRLPSISHVSIGGYALAAPQVLSNVKLLLLLGALLWVFVPSLFAPKPPRPSKTQQGPPEPMPSLASPLHVRRQAWLTAIQTVWVPRHNFILEAAALLLKTMKLSVRNTIGVHGYQMLTGLTEDQETARVKAWAIALDAQLAGGDGDINGSRLTLTLLASWTLPDTPLRLMLKALHIRVLIRQWGKNSLLNFLASEWARSNWNAAKQLKGMSGQTRGSPGADTSEDDLPEHLAFLLDQECDEVLLDDIVQRAHNLAWNRQTEHDVSTQVEGMSTVVDDPAVRSPMDAVAAWWSSMVLQRSLVTSLTAQDGGAESAQLVSDDIEAAAKAAPVGSNSQLRAVVARAALVDDNRELHIATAEQVRAPMLKSEGQSEGSTNIPALVDTPLSSLIPDPDVDAAMRCADATAYLQHYAAPDRTILTNIMSVMPDPTQSMSLLGCAAAFKLMNGLHANSVYAETCAGALEQLAGGLRVLVGGAASEGCCGLDDEVRHAIVERCITITRSLVGMESDTGYGSMSECEAEGGEC